MKTKTLSLFSFGLLSLVLFVSLASAACIEFEEVTIPTEVTEGEAFDVVVNVTHTAGACTVDRSGLTWDFTSNIVGVTWDSPTLTDLAVGETEELTIGFDLPTGETGTLSLDLNVQSDQADDETFELSDITINEIPEITNYCEFDNTGVENQAELKIEIDDIKVTQGFGKDEEWLPLDEIELTFELENKGDWDVEDISVEWGLYDESSDEWIIDLDEEKELNLKEGKDETIIADFKFNEKTLEVDFADLDSNYVLVVRATGTIDDSKADEYDGDETCDYDTENIEVILEDDFVVITDINIPDTVSCGMDAQIKAEVWNIGDSDQDDVTIKVYGKFLGIDGDEFEVGDIDAFESEDIVINLEMPEDAEEKEYTLEFKVYDEDNDVYENDYDDDKSITFESLTISGGCEVEPQALISAALESGGKAGKELVIKATITNTGSESGTFAVGATGYDSWASLENVDPTVIVLAKGEAKDVMLTFKVNKDAEGDKSFNIEATAEGETIRQPVAVTIEKSGFKFPGITGGAIGTGNWYLWGIGLLNVILIIIIIVVAVRVARS